MRSKMKRQANMEAYTRVFLKTDLKTELRRPVVPFAALALSLSDSIHQKNLRSQSPKAT
jgi:hypothetical protein